MAVGISLGILSGLLGHQLWMRLNERHFAPTAWSLRVVATLVALAVYHLLTEPLDFAENQPTQYGLALLAVGSLLAFVRQNLRGRIQAK